MLDDYDEILNAHHENINGEHLQVQIKKFHDGMEININTQWKKRFKTNCALLLLLFIVNIVMVRQQLFSFNCSTIFIVLSLVVAYKVVSIVQYERLLVIKSLGYQIITKSMLSESVQFVPWTTVEDVFINEVISLHRVLFILTLYTKGSNKKLIPLFTVTHPRLSCLQMLYRLLKTL